MSLPSRLERFVLDAAGLGVSASETTNFSRYIRHIDLMNAGSARCTFRV